jgi:hypothetical protein
VFFNLQENDDTELCHVWPTFFNAPFLTKMVDFTLDCHSLQIPFQEMVINEGTLASERLQWWLDVKCDKILLDGKKCRWLDISEKEDRRIVVVLLLSRTIRQGWDRGNFKPEKLSWILVFVLQLLFNSRFYKREPPDHIWKCAEATFDSFRRLTEKPPQIRSEIYCCKLGTEHQMASIFCQIG